MGWKPRICPACRAGKVLEEYVEGFPRYSDCGFCGGTGRIAHPDVFGLALRTGRGRRIDLKGK